MTIVVYIPTGLASPELEIMLAKSQAALDAGEQVTVVGCAGGPGYACSYNIYGMRGICKVCKTVRKRGISRLRGNFRYMETPSRIKAPIPDRTRLAILGSRSLIKSYRVEGVDVGQAAYSSYIGLSRDQDLEGRLAMHSLNRLLATSEELSSWFRRVLHELGGTRVILYNGRQNQYRPLLRVACQEKAAVEVMEFSGQEARCVYCFDNLPQDLDVLNRYIERNWADFTGDIEDCARNYYTYKRSGGVINDHRSYVLGQEHGRLPDGWDPTHHNIAIFNSSEDEYAAVGGDYDKTLYINQTEAITRICESLHDDKDVRIWLRIHPNLGKVRWSFAKRLLDLERKHSNVRVIAPLSPVSSYGVLDACDTAVSFGSTMGVEAAYWGKPSILIGRCIYERLGSVYTPQSNDEVIKLLRERKLPALPRTGALKVALFWGWGGRPISNFDGNRASGFTFVGMKIDKTRVERYRYGFFKVIEKRFLGDWVNYGLGRTRMRMATQR